MQITKLKSLETWYQATHKLAQARTRPNSQWLWLNPFKGNSKLPQGYGNY